MVQQLDGTSNEWGWCKQKVQLQFVSNFHIFSIVLQKDALFYFDSHSDFIFGCILQLGANAILAVSLAVCKAGASVKKIPLYQVCET